jgi:hypothetical protein
MKHPMVLKYLAMSVDLYNTAAYIAGYCGEFYAKRNEIIRTVEDLAIEGQTAQYLIDYPRPSTAGTALLCRQIFDVAHAGQDSNIEQRQQAGRIGGLMLILTDIVDGQIDRPDVPLETREHYLDEGTRVLLSGAESNFVPDNEHQRVSFDLASRLYESVVRKDEKGLFVSLFRSLVPDVKRQLTSDDLTEHLELAQRIGGTCALLAAASIEHVTGAVQPQVHIAAASIGAYAECLDHVYEMREDILEGIPTYVTLYLAQHGDTRANRRRAREDLLDVGSDVYREGLSALDGDQKPIYRAACRMLDARYRLIKRLSSIGNSRSCPRD